MNKKQIELMQAGRKNKSKKKVVSNVTMGPQREHFFKQIEEDFPSKRNLFIKAFSGSLRAAVNANCIACVWGDIEAIRHCKSVICPLHEVRPYQKKNKIKK